MPMTSLTIRIPPELKSALEQEAKRDSRSMSSIVILAVKAYLKDKAHDAD